MWFASFFKKIFFDFSLFMLFATGEDFSLFEALLCSFAYKLNFRARKDDVYSALTRQNRVVTCWYDSWSNWYKTFSTFNWFRCKTSSATWAISCYTTIGDNWTHRAKRDTSSNKYNAWNWNNAFNNVTDDWQSPRTGFSRCRSLCRLEVDIWCKFMKIKQNRVFLR